MAKQSPRQQRNPTSFYLTLLNWVLRIVVISKSEGEQETTGGKCPPSMSTVQNGFSMFRCVSTETRRTTSKGNNCNNLKQGDEVSSTYEAQHPSYEKYTGQKREHSNIEFLRSTSCTNALANSPQKVHSSSQKILFSSENFLDNAENRIKKRFGFG